MYEYFFVPIQLPDEFVVSNVAAAKQKSPSTQKATRYPALRDESAVSTQSMHQRPTTKQKLLSSPRCDDLIASHHVRKGSADLGNALQCEWRLVSHIRSKILFMAPRGD